MRAIYRVRQFVQALAAHALPGAAGERAAQDVLAPAALELFRRMSAPERRHAMRVLARVRAAGGCDPDLLAAALLHDVGKTCAPLRLWERPLPVLAGAFLPGLLSRWGRGEPRGWRRPFVVAVQHPRWGAELAAAAGCSPVTVALIRAHQQRGGGAAGGELLGALRAADDAG